MIYSKKSHQRAKMKYLIAIPFIALFLLIFSIPSQSKLKIDQPAEQTIDQNTSTMDTVPQEIFKVVEQMPRFPGCEDLKASDKAVENCAQQKLLELVGGEK